MRQTDPDRGQSPWKRGVRRNSQILICPACQATGEWRAELDQCAQCGSVRLVRRLGEVECRECGEIVPPPGEDLATDQLAGAGPPGPGLAGNGPSPGLSEEVALALDRVLGRSLVSQHAASPRLGPPRSVRPGAVTR